MDETKEITDIEPTSKVNKDKSKHSTVKGFVFLILLIIIIVICGMFFDTIANVFLDIANG